MEKRGILPFPNHGLEKGIITLIFIFKVRFITIFITTHMESAVITIIFDEAEDNANRKWIYDV